MLYSAQIETDSTMTGEDKQISHCWGRLRKADIIMSLVSVTEKKRDKRLRGAAAPLHDGNIRRRLFKATSFITTVCYQVGETRRATGLFVS